MLPLPKQNVTPTFHYYTTISFELIVNSNIPITIPMCEAFMHKLLNNLRYYCTQHKMMFLTNLIGEITVVKFSLDLVTASNTVINSDRQKVLAMLQQECNSGSLPNVDISDKGIAITCTLASKNEILTITRQPFRINSTYNSLGLTERILIFTLPQDMSQIPAPGSIQYGHNAFNEITSETNGSAALGAFKILMNNEISPTAVAVPKNSSPTATVTTSANTSPTTAIPIANLYGATFSYQTMDRIIRLRNVMTKKLGVIIGKDKALEVIMTSIKEDNFNQALRRACTSGKIEIVKLFIEYDQMAQLNLDFNAKSDKDSTPYSCACQSGNLELLELLVEKGAKANAIKPIP